MMGGEGKVGGKRRREEGTKEGDRRGEEELTLWHPPCPIPSSQSSGRGHL